MTPPTLRQLYSNHVGKTSDKWTGYLFAYDELFAPYRDQPVSMLEIGIQNGGSMEIWAKYFRQGKSFVGCDINEACRALVYEDERIHIVVGDANTDEVEAEILSKSPAFDIVLDDGSHQSRDIVLSFARYFGKLNDGGLYVAEDLHCSYWQGFQGGLFDPESSLSFFKRLSDVVNHEHWGIPASRGEILRTFVELYGRNFSEVDLEKVYSIEFRNSMCFIRKRPAADAQLGPRIIVGEDDRISAHGRGLHGRTSAEIGRADESGNPWSDTQRLPEEVLVDFKNETAALRSEASASRDATAALELEVAARNNALVEREAAFAALQEASTLKSRELTEDIAHLQAELRRSRRDIDGQRGRLGQLKDELTQINAQHAAILNSRGWRLVSRARQLAERFPRLSRFAWKAAKAMRLIGDLKFKQTYRALRQRRHNNAVAAALASSGLFDTEFYLSRYPDVAAFPGGALRHYVARGSMEGRHPHPLFDGNWFQAAYPQVMSRGANALLHYLENPHLGPNAFFDGQWYIDTYADIAASGANPLAHYVKFGAAENRDPSPRFSTRWYRQQNPQLAGTGTNPLAHFLSVGFAEGQSPAPGIHPARRGAPVTTAEIHCLKPPALSSEIGLFVAHCPDGKVKRHVQWYLDALKAAGIAVTLIAAADAPFEPDARLLSSVSGLFVRRNAGYDFAAWAHVLRLRPDLLDAETIYLLNDSLIGPFNQEDFAGLLAQIRKSSANLVGLTASHERTGWHLQSFFLALKKRLLTSVAFQGFFNDVTVLDDKDDVINSYELQFAPAMRAAGFECAAMFETESRDNPTLHDWRRLIEEGFPFVKVMVVRDRFDTIDTGGWRELIAAEGYDVAIAEQTLADAKKTRMVSGVALPLSSAPYRPVEPVPARPRIAFIGPWNFDNGLAVAGRSYIAALRRTGFLVNLHPVRRPFHVHRQIAPAIDVCDFSGDADIVLVQVNPDGWNALLAPSQFEIIRKARLRIGLWVWESPSVPSSWLPMMSEVDAIWAPSRYCAEAFSRSTQIPVHVIPYVVPEVLESAIRPSNFPRAANAEKIILYAFDSSSYLVRKNPFALIRAFDKSGLHSRGWKLVLKTKHVPQNSAKGKEFIGLVERCAGAILMDHSLDKESMAELMQAASIYASPHCAEGFGLTVAEAMALGKIVVATDYSGTADFLDHNCGYPVPYTLRELDSDHGAYKRGNIWAEIDEDSLLKALCSAANAVEANDLSLGNAARRQVKRLLSAEAVANQMLDSFRHLHPDKMLMLEPAETSAP